MAVSDRAPLPLEEGRVDVWLTPLDGAGGALDSAYEGLLSEAERARWQRFLVPGARRQYLVARALVRTTLSLYAEVPAAAWRFDANRYGRPAVAAPPVGRAIHFNLSHTEGLVACAVSRAAEIGVDVEHLDRDFDLIALAPTVFAPAEVADVARAPPEIRRDRFFSYWTLKESYIKARGMGLSLALDGFCFELGGAVPRIRFTERCPDDAARWRFRQYRPTAWHKLAVAVSLPLGQEPDIHLRWVVPLAAAPA